MSAKWAPKVAKTVYTTLYHLLPSLLFLVANYALAESNVSSTPALDVPSSQLASSVYLRQGKESLNNVALP